jgi:hypothetical protein
LFEKSRILCHNLIIRKWTSLLTTLLIAGEIGSGL